MASVLKMTVEGGDAVESRLKTLPNNVIRKYSKRALKAGVQPIVAGAKASVPVRYGYLRSAIGEIVKEYPAAFVAIPGVRRDTRAAMSKGIGRFRHAIGSTRGGGTRYAVPAFYAHLVEFGTRPHAVGKGDRLPRAGERYNRFKHPQRGRMHPGAKANPFFETAVASHTSEILPIVAEVLSEGFLQEASGS